jgi:predicted TPR repeat methyltransferase
MEGRDRPRIPASVRIVPTEAGLLACDLEARVVHELNPTAAAILSLCDGTRDADTIEKAVASLRAGAGDAAAGGGHVRAWLQDAEEEGLVSLEGPGGELREIESPTQLAELAERLHEEGELTKAIGCQRRLAELLAEDPDAWFLLGEYLHALGDREGARDAYGRYLELVGDDPEVAHLVAALSGGEAGPRAPDEAVASIYETFAQDYEEVMRGELEYRAPELLVELLAARLPAAARVLDVADLGCGTGLVGRLVKPWARTLAGVDLAPAMVERSRETGVYDELHAAELIAWLGQRPEAFDLLVACDVLLYQGDLSAPLCAAARALRPGGLLALTLERLEGDGYRLMESGRYAHGRGEVLRAAAGAGLDVLEVGSAELREEYGRPVRGWLALLERSSQPVE